MRAYDTGEATRRRTTTRNANADWCNERIESLRTQIRALETQIGASRAQGGGERTIYDQRSAIARQVEVAAPQLYSALQNLLDAVMERDVQQSIESVVLSDAESALAAARVGGAS